MKLTESATNLTFSPLITSMPPQPSLSSLPTSGLTFGEKTKELEGERRSQVSGLVTMKKSIGNRLLIFTIPPRSPRRCRR